MTAIIGKLWEGYNFLFDELPDERTKPWFLMAKPYQGLTLLSLYLMFVLKWGPKYMKRRPAYNLDRVLIVYNFLQVTCCTYTFYYGITLAWGWDYQWLCEPVDLSTSKRAMDIAKTMYLYFLMKIVDLLDTVFFVLRKKSNQISFLHIYHHTGMVMLVWAAVTYLPGGHGTFVGVINSFVHIIMYSYYLYTVVNPSAKQSIWWKKHITQLQIIQFAWCVFHMLAIVFKPDCAYPRWVSAVFLPQNFFVLVLFVDFYIKTYVKKPQNQKNKPIKTDLHIKPENEIINDSLANNNELKTLNTSNNCNGEKLQNASQSQQNEGYSTQNGAQHQLNRPFSLQNGTISSQIGTRSSINESHYFENGSRTGNSYHDDKYQKHGKME